MSLLGKEWRQLRPEDLRRMNVGKRFWNVALEKIPDQATYKQELTAYIERLKPAIEGGYGLMLNGPYRQGKTSSAVILMKAVVAHGGTAFFIRADEVAGVVIEKTRFDEDQTMEERMRSVDLLVIDDLGTDTTREVGAGLMERLIRWRYDTKKSLVVTANKSMEELARKFNEGTLMVMRSTMKAVRVDGMQWFDEESAGVKMFFNGDERKASP